MMIKAISAKKGEKSIIPVAPPKGMRRKGLIRGSVMSLSKTINGLPCNLGNQDRTALAIMAHSNI